MLIYGLSNSTPSSPNILYWQICPTKKMIKYETARALPQKTLSGI